MKRTLWRAGLGVHPRLLDDRGARPEHGAVAAGAADVGVGPCRAPVRVLRVRVRLAAVGAPADHRPGHGLPRVQPQRQTPEDETQAHRHRPALARRNGRRTRGPRDRGMNWNCMAFFVFLMLIVEVVFPVRKKK